MDFMVYAFQEKSGYKPNNNNQRDVQFGPQWKSVYSNLDCHSQ